MKVIFISSGIHVGGFTNSLVSMIGALQSREVEVDLLLLRRTDDEGLLDGLRGVNILENPLSIEFAWDERSKSAKFWALVRTGRAWNRLWLEIGKRTLYRGGRLTRRAQNRFSQIDDERRVRGMRSHLDLVDDYDCVVSWEESLCNYLLANNIRAKRKVGYIHPDYVQGGFYAAVDRRMMHDLDAIAFVSESNRVSFCRAIPELCAKAITVPNVLGVSEIRRRSLAETSEMEGSDFTLLTVCRLQNVSKALDRAARVCARMKNDGLSFKWFIVGGGPDRAKLEAQVRELGIQNEMILLGERMNPYPFIRQADLLVLQSYYEGRPLVVDEAKILGTPVFVSDYASAREQVIESRSGFVVANEEEAIAAELSSLIRNPQRLVEVRASLSNRVWPEFTDCSALLRACGDDRLN